MFSVLEQMLNCCIERKKARDDARKVLDEGKERAPRESGPSAAAATSTREVSPGKSWESWSDSEEEFFECLSDQGEMDTPQTEEEKPGSKRKAEGRLHPYNSMTLLNSSEPLYVPVTQVSICLLFTVACKLPDSLKNRSDQFMLNSRRYFQMSEVHWQQM